MIRKFGLTVTGLLFLQIFSLSIVYGEIENEPTKMEHDPTKDLAELLKDEDKSKFFSNSITSDFIVNFDKKVTLEASKNNILIKEGSTVVLKGSLTKEYSTILIEGNLRIFDTGDSSLRVQKIIIGPTGSLLIGYEKEPISDKKNVEIVFVKNKEGEIGIFVFGKLIIQGKKIEPVFVGLQNYAKAGEKKIVIDKELENWKIGDTVVITSPGNDKCNEIAEISKILRPYVSIKNPLNCSHRGPVSDTENSIVSHVALLSRNVRISSDDDIDRGSVNFFHGSSGYIKYSEFDKLGPKNVLGRYPIHFHHLEDTSRGIEVIGNSITNSDNRWVTIHDSNGVLVKNNVGYISQGHGFFLEDGNEFDNVFENNIGIITRTELILGGASSVFWTMNPMNVYRDNIAVNGQYWGYSFQIFNNEVDLPSTGKKFNARSLPNLEFEGNTAYNNGIGGLKISRPMIKDNNLTSSEIVISNFHAMAAKREKPTFSGIGITGSGVTVSNATLLNYEYGVFLAGENNKVIDTTIRMESNMNLDAEISGIVIAGGNNIIESSEIEGYISNNNYRGTDISLSNDKKYKKLLSAKIINTTLLDPIPFYFGEPVDENSFLEIYGYDAPTARIKKLPQNFMLKMIGSEPIEARGEYNNLDFNAMIKMIPKTKPENQVDENIETNNDNDEITKSDLIKKFKNKAIDWKKNKLTDQELINEIEIIFESSLIEIIGIEQDSFQEYQFRVPQWVKKLVDFWSMNSISDQEFINAIKYILESNLSENLSPYGFPYKMN